MSVLEDSEDSESGSGSYWPVPASAASHTYSTLPRPRPPESRYAEFVRFSLTFNSHHFIDIPLGRCQTTSVR